MAACMLSHITTKSTVFDLRRDYLAVLRFSDLLCCTL